MLYFYLIPLTVLSSYMFRKKFRTFEVKSMMDAADENDDGVISKEEFLHLFENTTKKAHQLKMPENMKESSSSESSANERAKTEATQLHKYNEEALKSAGKK